MRATLLMIFAVAFSPTGCSVGSTSAPVSPPPAQVLPNGDAGPVAPKDGGLSTGLLNGCKQADFDANDATAPADPRTITFSTKVEDEYKYTPPCMKIKAGQSVTWSSPDGQGHAFLIHPLEPLGGDPQNPISPPADGDTATFAFPTAGIFGFHCTEHPGLMFGAILVVP